MQHSWDAMRRELGGGGGTTQDGVGVATHVRKPGYSCTSPTRLLIPDRKLASSHRHMRHYVALLSWPVLTACLSFATPAAARPAHCFNVLSSLSPPRARAARSHLSSSWHTTSVTNQDNADVDRANRCIMFMLLSVCPETPPHACRSVALSPSLAAISIPRSFAHSLARQNAQHAALLATKAGRRTVV
jgi:hypothetical protein